jgi:peptidoglycan hydrolase-like protein with peptidoglycan-binding domain
MLLAIKTEWAAIVFTLLTTAMLVQIFPQSVAASDSHQEEVAPFVMKNEITKMQETLRDKGHYRGKVDGVFGLRTRASIRAYQKAEKFQITGQVDSRTAHGLGVRPERTWDNSQTAERAVGQGSDRIGSEIERGKPSANVKWTNGARRTTKTLRKPVKPAAAPESHPGDGARTLQAGNDVQPQ